METTFLVWSASTASQEKRPDVAGGSGAYLSHPATKTLLLSAAAGADLEPSREQLPQPQPAPAPRASKKKKPAAAPKRPPQRGLGVEKLERLRLQERWRKMTEIEPPSEEQQIQTPAGAGTLHGHQQNHHHHNQLLHYAVGAQSQAPHSPFGMYSSFPVYDPQHQAGVSRLSLARFAAAPAPVGYGGAWGESCFLQRHRMLGAGGFLGSSGSISAVRSAAFPDQGGVDRFRMATAEASFHVGCRPSELPSSQSLQCSEECDICIRKCMLEANSRPSAGIGGSGERKEPIYLFGLAVDRKADASADQIVDGKGMMEVKEERVELKEYEFFPCNSSSTTTSSTSTTSTTYGAGSFSGASAFGNRTTVGEHVPPSASVSSSTKLDLSLKLSF